MVSRHHPTQTLENVSHALPPPPTTPTTYHLPHTTTNHHHLTTTAATCRNSKTTIIIIIIIIIIMIIRKQTATTASSNETLSLQQVLIKSTKTGAKEVLYGLIDGLSTVQNAHHWRQKSWDCFQHLHIEIPMTGCWAFSAGLMMVTSLLSKADRSSVHFGATALNSLNHNHGTMWHGKCQLWIKENYILYYILSYSLCGRRVSTTISFMIFMKSFSCP